MKHKINKENIYSHNCISEIEVNTNSANLIKAVQSKIGRYRKNNIGGFSYWLPKKYQGINFLRLETKYILPRITLSAIYGQEDVNNVRSGFHKLVRDLGLSHSIFSNIGMKKLETFINLPRTYFGIESLLSKLKVLLQHPDSPHQLQLEDKTDPTNPAKKYYLHGSFHESPLKGDFVKELSLTLYRITSQKAYPVKLEIGCRFNQLNKNSNFHLVRLANFLLSLRESLHIRSIPLFDKQKGQAIRIQEKRGSQVSIQQILTYQKLKASLDPSYENLLLPFVLNKPISSNGFCKMKRRFAKQNIYI